MKHYMILANLWSPELIAAMVVNLVFLISFLVVICYCVSRWR